MFFPLTFFYLSWQHSGETILHLQHKYYILQVERHRAHLWFHNNETTRQKLFNSNPVGNKTNYVNNNSLIHFINHI